MVTTVIAISILLSYSNVPGSQEPTYQSSDDGTTEQVDTATTTQPDTGSIPAEETVPTTVVTKAVATFPIEKQEVVEEILKVFPDAPIMVMVAKCESGLNPSADRKGIDGGLFQINQVHKPRLEELGLDRYDLHDNLTYARMLYDERGLGDWYMSEHCWRKYL